MVYVHFDWFVYKIMEVSSLSSYLEMVYVHFDWFVYKILSANTPFSSMTTNLKFPALD